MSAPLKISTPADEGVLGISKSRKFPLLIDLEEMEDLMDTLGMFFIFDGSRPLTLDSVEISREEFLRIYGGYVNGIKRGELIEEVPLCPYFSSIWTLSSEGVYAQRLSNGKFLVKSKVPPVQLQRHHFTYSKEGFHSGVMGRQSVTWGIQFSYPHLFMDPKTKAIGKVENHSQFPNTHLFKQLAKWVRAHTRPTPFVAEGEATNQPMRLGRGCFDWINNHPQLKEKGLYVQPSSRGNH